MRPSIVETIIPQSLPAQLPIRLEQKAANAVPLLILAVLVPAAGALLVPFLALAKALTNDPGVRLTLASHPIAAVQLALAFAFWTVLFAWPIKRIANQISRNRTVEIAGGRGSVVDRSLLSTTAWSEPLSAFAGVEHRVRSNLSGVRHELILAHPNQGRHVLLALAPRLSEAEIAQVKGLFSVPVSPSRELYLRLQDAYGVAEQGQIATARSRAA